MKMLFRFILLSFVTFTATAASATIVTNVIDVTKFGALGDGVAIETKNERQKPVRGGKVDY